MIKLKKAFLPVIVLLHVFLFSNGQQPGGYLFLETGPQISFTQNTDLQYKHNNTSKTGMGYSGLGGYGYQFRSGFFIETGLGYYSFQQSVNEKLLHLPIPAGGLSYKVHYLQAAYNIGYTVLTYRKNLNVTAILGTRFLLYLPEEDPNTGDWNYLDLNLFSSGDTRVARYQGWSSAYAIWAFIMHSGIRANYTLSPSFSCTAMVFCDIGFKSLRADGFHSEEIHEKSPSYYNSFTAANKGDAIGFHFGLQYHFRH